MILKQRIKSVPLGSAGQKLKEHVQGQNCPVLEYSAQQSTEASQTPVPLGKQRGQSNEKESLPKFPSLGLNETSSSNPNLSSVMERQWGAELSWCSNRAPFRCLPGLQGDAEEGEPALCDLRKSNI